MGDFELELLNSKRIRANLLAGSIVTEWLVILHLHATHGRRYPWLLFRP